eukprot:CAMPEP_0178388800 /NCGR_PEP_ID=MMETSP0689_2-20121128/9782_1 /TAXON_ID=160604 /ORGANISM="Amphidinium massartii, Strain CS-259" /LENGTH=137 /DNA_ID=CAMNT_0020009219 /DNA_START=153 /DNA_END=563 /DNA_ORIENTATION=-
MPGHVAKIGHSLAAIEPVLLVSTSQALPKDCHLQTFQLVGGLLDAFQHQLQDSWSDVHQWVLLQGNHFSKIRFAKVTMKSSFASPILTRHTSSTRDRLCPKSTFTRSYTSSGLISSVTLIAAAWEDIRAEVAVECIR